MIRTICLLGFGEVGQILAEDLASYHLTAWDVLFADPHSKPSQALAARSVTAGASAEAAVAEADLVVSAVTAAQDLAAARAVAGGLRQGAFFLDFNSASPEMKKRSASIVDDAGGRYVEAAVMAPIGPKRIATPMLLGGPHAEAFLPEGRAAGFAGMRLFSAEYGKASAAKMCRSVMVKGIEALLTESLISARHYGVEQIVLDSLSDLFPVGDWPKLARYMISRALEHGTRRAEEMREVAQTVSDAGLAPLLSAATAERQDWAAARKQALEAETDSDSLADLLDRLLAMRNDRQC
jgi:3-hydroxyisobutyrate dehydrogenase-like beta-hydroxyacid dehydrogenase